VSHKTNQENQKISLQHTAYKIKWQN